MDEPSTCSISTIWILFSHLENILLESTFWMTLRLKSIPHLSRHSKLILPSPNATWNEEMRISYVDQVYSITYCWSLANAFFAEIMISLTSIHLTWQFFIAHTNVTGSQLLLSFCLSELFLVLPFLFYQVFSYLWLMSHKVHFFIKVHFEKEEILYNRK